MLRRIERTESGESWILIPQIEHARLSGALAESWGDASFRAIDPATEVLAAITHHDDGWADWDAMPGVDPVAGRPLSFVEMPLDAAIDIWRRSIYLCRSRGPLAGHMVSNHFTELLQQSSPKWSHDPQRFQTSRQFLDDQSEHREIWLAEWQRGNPATRTRKVAARALAYLQFFDALSLWLCAAVRRDEETLATPEGVELTFTPAGALRFAVRPWPLTVGRLQWVTNARRVPVGHFASREALTAVPGEVVQLSFELVPAG